MLLFLYSSKKINLCEKKILFEENYSLHCPATDLTRVLLLSAGGGVIRFQELQEPRSDVTQVDIRSHMEGYSLEHCFIVYIVKFWLSKS